MLASKFQLPVAKPLRAHRQSRVALAVAMPRLDTTHDVHSTPAPDYTWVRSKLANALVGLQYQTRRAKVTTKDVLNVAVAKLRNNKLTSKPSCTSLDVDVVWEAELLQGAGTTAGSTAEDEAPKPMQGMARLKLNSTGCHDTVEITDIQALVADESDENMPLMPSPDINVPKDVVLAVESMDSVFMENLNSFLWEVEERNFPLNSFCEDDEGDGMAAYPDVQEAQSWMGQEAGMQQLQDNTAWSAQQAGQQLLAAQGV